MADLLENASAWLTEQRARFLSRQVVYGRGDDSVQIAATVGTTTFDVDDGYGVVQTWQSRDYLVAAADLILGGAVTKPQRGDRITDNGKVYEVMTPGKEDVFKPSDQYGLTLRIHTKQVE